MMYWELESWGGWMGSSWEREGRATNWIWMRMDGRRGRGRGRDHGLSEGWVGG